MKKVLIVDDVKGWRDFHTSVVKKIFGAECQVDCADSAEDGYNRLVENMDFPYDLILTDLQMEENYFPLMAGEWFIKQIKTFSKYSKSKIVLISASYKIKHIAELLEVDYIPKPAARQDIEEYRKVLF